MHPILADWRRLAVYLLAWVPIGFFLMSGLGQGVPWPVAALLFLPLTLVYAFVCLSAWYTTRVFPIDVRSRLGAFFVSQLAAGAMAGGIWVLLGELWTGMLFSLGSADVLQLFITQRPLVFLVGTLLFWLAAASHAALLAVERSHAAERRAAEQHLIAREAELKALRAQVDPHFLFNSLHSISALTTADAAAARHMCLLLADFLRDTLRFAPGRRISLANELALAERFLAIERVRLGARLQVTLETDPAAAACEVPPLVLQPLLENAIVHGVDHLVAEAHVALSSRLEDTTLVIRVVNACDPDRPKRDGSGVGLDIVRRRLQAEFGGRGTLHARDLGASFSAEIRMPATVGGV